MGEEPDQLPKRSPQMPAKPKASEGLKVSEGPNRTDGSEIASVWRDGRWTTAAKSCPRKVIERLPAESCPRKVAPSTACPAASPDEEPRAFRYILGAEWAKQLVKKPSAQRSSGLKRQRRAGLRQSWGAAGSELVADPAGCRPYEGGLRGEAYEGGHT